MTSNRDLVSWGDKAKVLFKFEAAAANMIRETDDELVKVGAMMGTPMLLAFAIECVLKELLEQEEGKSKWGHEIQKRFLELQEETRRKAISTYSGIVKREMDPSRTYSRRSIVEVQTVPYARIFVGNAVIGS